MRRRGFKAFPSIPLLSGLALLFSLLAPITFTQASAAPTLVTCINLQTGIERISKTGFCRKTKEAQANWHKNPSDSTLASGSTAKVIVVCSNKKSTTVSYQFIRNKCQKHQLATVFSRSASLPTRPVIAEVVAQGHDSASIRLAAYPTASSDAPIAFYTITSTTVDTRTPVKVQSKRVYFWDDLSADIETLESSTRYTFTVSATTADGTSPISMASISVTTEVYVPPAPPNPTPPDPVVTVAAPVFTLSSTTETKTVNSAISGYTISSTGGAIASYSISPAVPAGISFNSSTGLLSGTPTASQSATVYTITATNAGGFSVRTFTLTVSSSAPSFTFSSTSETRVVTTPLAGYAITSTGAAVASYSLVGTKPAWMSFNTSTGLISGTPTETMTATNYTVIGTSASGETATATYQLRVTGDIGDTGPGGGRIFYYSSAGFACGPLGTSTCKYLEVAPNNWNGSDPAVSWAQSSPVNLAAPGNNLNLAATIGLGAVNTKAIVDQGNTTPATSAAAWADSYSVTIGGVSYGDWFLPSENELVQLFNQRTAVGFVPGNYWSSTSLANENGRYVFIAPGPQQTVSASGNLKTTANFLRPIRAF